MKPAFMNDDEGEGILKNCGLSAQFLYTSYPLEDPARHSELQASSKAISPHAGCILTYPSRT
jgi:hypothetical protein